MIEEPEPASEDRRSGARVPRSVLTALRTLEELAQNQPIGVGALARKMDLPKSTMQRVLSSLEAGGFAYRSGNPPTWSLTLKVFHIGAQAMQDLDVRRVAAPLLAELRDETRESALLTMRDRYQTLIIDRYDSPEPVRAHVEEGMAFPIHCTAGGKALLAAMDDDFVKEVLEQPLEQLTTASLTEPGALREELGRIRERGFAINHGEARAEVFAVAAAVRDATGYPVAATVLAAPSSRTGSKRMEQLGKRVLSCARGISAKLGWEAQSA